MTDARMVDMNNLGSAGHPSEQLLWVHRIASLKIAIGRNPAFRHSGEGGNRGVELIYVPQGQAKFVLTNLAS